MVGTEAVDVAHMPDRPPRFPPMRPRHDGRKRIPTDSCQGISHATGSRLPAGPVNLNCYTTLPGLYTPFLAVQKCGVVLWQRSNRLCPELAAHTKL